MLTDTEILDCFAQAPVQGHPNHLIAVGRAIERLAVADALANLDPLMTLLGDGRLVRTAEIGRMEVGRG